MSAPDKRVVTRSASIGGAVAAAMAASACCIGPLVLALLGIGGAGFLVALEPYRPIFTVLTLGLLAAGWYLTYREPRSTATAPSGLGSESSEGDSCGCEMPEANKAGRWMLWVATGIIALALVFPYLTPYLF